jgi:flagellar biosynthetic protein FlhB
MADDMGNKTEQPTGKRLQDAREKGQIPKSIDLTGTLDLIAAAIVVWYFSGDLTTGLMEVMKTLLEGGGPAGPLDQDGAIRLFGWALIKGFLSAWKFFVVMTVFLLCIQLKQSGFNFTLKPLEPKWERLNIFTGFGKIFNKRNSVKTVINSLKLAIVTMVVFSFTSAHLHEMARLPALELTGAAKIMFAMIIKLLAWVLAVMLFMGVADYLYQRWQHTEDLKMTKQEVKDEAKAAEGDVGMRAKRLNMGREMITQRLKSTVPKADVVVTNPTHFAVAMRYDPATMAAPVVIAKGADYVALRIRELATASGVPIIEKPPLARALYHNVPVGREVPSQFYEAVAELLAYVYRISGKAEQAQQLVQDATAEAV